MFPLLNALAKQFATDPKFGQVFFGSDYYLDLSLTEAPEMNIEAGFIEA